jgi:hypothetical protein
LATEREISYFALLCINPGAFVSLLSGLYDPGFPSHPLNRGFHSRAFWRHDVLKIRIHLFWCSSPLTTQSRSLSMRIQHPLVLLLVTNVLTGCPTVGDILDTDTDTDTDTGPVEALELAGMWIDNWESLHEISNEAWTTAEDTWTFTSSDNDARFAIAQNHIDNAYFPGLWSRFDWTWHQNTWWFCHTAYDAETETQALETPAAQDAEPSVTGCGEFSWTRLDEALEIRGEYTDGENDHNIDEKLWDVGDENRFHLSSYDNTYGFIIAQNDADNQNNANLWSRFQWVFVSDILYYCHMPVDADSATSAENATRPDDAEPATTGCGEQPWTMLNPVQ